MGRWVGGLVGWWVGGLVGVLVGWVVGWFLPHCLAERMVVRLIAGLQRLIRWRLVVKAAPRLLRPPNTELWRLAEWPSSLTSGSWAEAASGATAVDSRKGSSWQPSGRIRGRGPGRPLRRALPPDGGVRKHPPRCGRVVAPPKQSGPRPRPPMPHSLLDPALGGRQRRAPLHALLLHVRL